MIPQKDPTILVIFGGMGDLTWRKLAPALYNLLLDQQLPERFAVVGLDIKDGNTEEFRIRLRDGANNFCDCGGVDEKTWGKFTSDLSYISGDFANPATYAALNAQLKDIEKELGLSRQSCFLPGHTTGYRGNHCRRDWHCPTGSRQAARPDRRGKTFWP